MKQSSPNIGADLESVSYMLGCETVGGNYPIDNCQLTFDSSDEWTVRANWRVTFRFVRGHAQDIDLEDYH